MTRKQITALIATGAAGLAAAAALTLPSAAAAYTIDQLPNMGYSVAELNLGNNCHSWTVTGYGASANLGSDCDSGFQSALDGFVDRTYPKPPVTTTAAATTTTATTTTEAATTETTTTATTTTATATTDTTATVTAPAATTAPAPTQTDPAAAPATSTVSAPVSAPTATTPTCDLQCEIDGLQAQIDSLRSELTQLEQILKTWPGIDPGILAQLMAIQG